MKHVVVIGATSGIGRGLARRLAAAGYRVGAVGRRVELLSQLAAEQPAAFCTAAADISRSAEVVAALERLVGELGGMELCIVCAGTGELNPGLDFSLEEPAIRTNVLGWTAVVDWACGHFERQGGGHLVVLTSVGGLRGGSGIRRDEGLSDQLCRGAAAARCQIAIGSPCDRHPPRAGRYGHGQGRRAVLGDARGAGRDTDHAGDPSQTPCRRRDAPLAGRRPADALAARVVVS